MTSSLVGSEMCIRDSFMPLVDRSIADVWPCGSLARDAGGWIADWRSRIWICLLYTSDAADDM
eukprot:22052-Prorocentrum_lima.AAC.1